MPRVLSVTPRATGPSPRCQACGTGYGACRGTRLQLRLASRHAVSLNTEVHARVRPADWLRQSELPVAAIGTASGRLAVEPQQPFETGNGAVAGRHAVAHGCRSADRAGPGRDSVAADKRQDDGDLPAGPIGEHSAGQAAGDVGVHDSGRGSPPKSSAGGSCGSDPVRPYCEHGSSSL